MTNAIRIRLAASLLSALAALPAVAAERPAQAKLPGPKEVWLLSESPSFSVLGNVSAKKVTEIAETLERFRATLLLLKPDANPLSPVPSTFVAFTNDRSFDPYKGSPETRDTRWVGTYQTTPFGNYFAVNAYPEQGSGMAIVLGGYAAHFIQSNYPTTPLWLVQGLSEFYGTFRVEDGVADVGRVSPENLDLLRRGVLLPLREILEMTPASPGFAPDHRAMFDAQAWVLAHFLLYGSADGQQRTADFLRRLDAGEAQAAAFQTAFGTDLEKFEGRLRQYAARPAFDYARIPLGELPPTGATVPRAIPRAEALTRLAALPAVQRRFEFAQLHLDAALAEQPGDGDAWALAGRIAELRGDEAGAAAAYARALFTTLDLAVSWYHIGAWQLPQGRSASSFDSEAERKASAAAARSSAEKALQLAPEFAEAMALKGRAAMLQEEYPAAVAAFAAAQMRLPERADIVYNRVIAHLAAGQLVQARALVEGRMRRIAKPAEVAEARAMVAQRESAASQRESAAAIQTAVAEANRASAAGDLDGAIAAFVAAQAQAKDGEAKEYIARQIEELRQAKRLSGEVDAFNAAVAQINAGKLTAGRDALRLLLADCRQAELCAQAQEILGQVEKHLKGRK